MDNDARIQTIRQEIINSLETGPLTVREISQSIRIMEKEVFYHLEFIEKTVRTQNRNIKIKPYYCMGCGFEFRKRKKFKKPGKCPVCKDSRIASTVFWIEG